MKATEFRGTAKVKRTFAVRVLYILEVTEFPDTTSFNLFHGEIDGKIQTVRNFTIRRALLEGAYSDKFTFEYQLLTGTQELDMPSSASVLDDQIKAKSNITGEEFDGFAAPFPPCLEAVDLHLSSRLAPCTPLSELVK